MFPTLADAATQTVMAILFQLERSQWWTPEDLHAHQFRQLDAVLRHAQKNVPFYRQRLLQAVGDNPAPLTLERWRSIPLLTRSEIQSAGETLHALELPPGHGSASEIFTSGSTGKPVRVLRSHLWGRFWRAFTIRDHLWHRDTRGKLAVIRDSGKGLSLFPHGSEAPVWSEGTASVLTTGPRVGLNMNSSVEQQVSWLTRQEPDYLLTFPTLVQRLAEHCLANGIRFKGLKQVETISEVLRPHIRVLARKAWSVPVVDMYTTRETGYLALQCPEHEHYHIQSEGVFVEVLNERGRACAAGETGKVVVTPLQNFAMPLVRYDIGDRAEVGPPCPCGRGLPVITHILGRIQNMLTLPTGEQRFPLLSSDNIKALLATAPIDQYQIVQKEPNLIQLRLVVRRALTAKEENALRHWVHEKFAHPFEVVFDYTALIPRTAGGKYFDFVSELAQ